MDIDVPGSARRLWKRLWKGESLVLRGVRSRAKLKFS